MTKNLIFDDQEEALTSECIKALTEIFLKFDIDLDGHLNLAELKEFSKFTNGQEFTKDVVTEIQTYFDSRESDMALSLKGFIEMYTLQSSVDQEETEKDLKKHGFYNF